jgi:hypothetical protein
MALKIKDSSTGAQSLSIIDVEGALDCEPAAYDGEPTDWKRYLISRYRAELEVALLDLCRFFVAQVAAEQGKSVATLRLADSEHQVIVQGRNSAADDGRGGSARAQMFIAAKKLVAEDGWPVEVWYEYAQSAYLKWTKPRVWYQRKFELVEAGEAKAKILMPTFPSRKTRRLSEMTAWLDLLEHKGMRMICASEKGHHLDTDLDQVKRWWVDQAAIHEGSSEASSKMIQNKQFEMLADGIATHGYGQCYGYEPLIDPKRLNKRGKPQEVGARLVRRPPAGGGRSEAEWLTLALERRLAGLSWSAIESDLYRAGCRSRSGKMIRADAWKKMLTAPRVIGCERKNNQLFRVQIERVLTDEQYEALMANEGLDPMTGKSVGERKRAQRRVYPLSGLLHCCCGAPMVGSRRRKYPGGPFIAHYKCSQPNRRLARAAGSSWTVGSVSDRTAMDGEQHTTMPVERVHTFFRVVCSEAMADYEAELWRRLDSLAAGGKPAAEIHAIEHEIAQLDADLALLGLQLKLARTPGYRGEKIGEAEAERQIDGNAARRAALVGRWVKLNGADAPNSVFARGADVRAEILGCTDGELTAYVKLVFAWIGVRRWERSGQSPERRIEWQFTDGFHIGPDVVERLLEEADTAHHLRFVAAAKTRRVEDTLEDDAYRLAKQGLGAPEITRELNELGYRTKNGRELRNSHVAYVVRRVVFDRDNLFWFSPPRDRGLPDELLDRVERMRDGGATWAEVNEAFGMPGDRIRGGTDRQWVQFGSTLTASPAASGRDPPQRHANAAGRGTG